MLKYVTQKLHAINIFQKLDVLGPLLGRDALLLDSRTHKSLTFRWLLTGGLTIAYFHLQDPSQSLSDATPVTEL